MSQALPHQQQSAVAYQPTRSVGAPVSTGFEWIVDATGCDPLKLARQTVLQALCDAVISDIQLKVIGSPQWHQFPSPGGVTGLYLLSESHLSCHSFPEYQLLTVNLYCCREHACWDWRPQLECRLGATEVVLRKINRGIPAVNTSMTSGELT